MKVDVMQITPEVATEMLSRNPYNRPIRSKTVDMYADDMRRGAWEETSQAITFDKDGNLLDGQHRLNAVIRSGVAINALVVSDMPRSGMYDAGLTRSTVDRLIMGGGNITKSIISSMTCAACNFLIGIKNSPASKRRRSTAEIRDFMVNNEDVLLKACDIIGSKRTLGISVAPVIAALISALHSNVDVEVVRRFYQVLVTGISMSSEEHPIIALRNKLLSDRAKKVNERDRLDIYRRTQFAIRNYVLGTGRSMTKCPNQDLYNISDMFKEATA